MKKWRLIVVLISLLLAAGIFVITREAVLETENWKFLDLDYLGKADVISSYGSLLAGLLSSISIILLVYTILFQSKESKEQTIRFESESTKQERRFRKAHKLQKKQFKAEQRREERKEKLDLYYKLKLIGVFLESIINHVEKTGVELRRFYLAEESKPLNMNMLYFLVNKSMTKLIEMDYLSIFIAFKEFFHNREEDWTKNFNNLFGLVL